MANSQLFLILVLAMVAGIILFRLYSVLGRRTGNERESADKGRWSGLPGTASRPTTREENVVTLPQRAGSKSDDPVQQGLVEIKLVDRTFETEHFLSGARKAYEMIVTAYAAGDRATLRPLLSDEVYSAFESAISEREKQSEKTTFSFKDFSSAKIVHAELKKRTAEITVEFSVQYVSSTSDAAGTVIEGNPDTPRDVIDHWTFARDTGANDPNWILVATQNPA
jgi:predicted lipid-binding transport protein (Tim44 family)